MLATDLTGKVALVTGASRGLGAAIALALGQRGAKVAVNYFGSVDKAQAVCDQIDAAGGHARPFQADVFTPDGANKLIAEVVAAFGDIDILVLNATGPQPFIKLEDITWDDYLQQFTYFVRSPMMLTQQVIGPMKQKRAGRIIHIGSEVFEMAVPEFSNYVSAKGAQLGLCRSWSRELAPWQITVNLVAPGWIPTERHSDDPADAKAAYAKAVPMGHMGQPRDIGQTVAFLASDAAGFITGQKISVNGGNSVE